MNKFIIWRKFCIYSSFYVDYSHSFRLLLHLIWGLNKTKYIQQLCWIFFSIVTLCMLLTANQYKSNSNYKFTYPFRTGIDIFKINANDCIKKYFSNVNDLPFVSTVQWKFSWSRIKHDVPCFKILCMIFVLSNACCTSLCFYYFHNETSLKDEIIRVNNEYTIYYYICITNTVIGFYLLKLNYLPTDCMLKPHYFAVFRPR